MELRQSITDYTLEEFSEFLTQIYAVDGSKAEHDRLINHFDKIVGLSQGADLLFYPKPDEFGNSYGSDIDRVIDQIRAGYRSQGRLAFRNDAFPAVPPRTPQLSPRDYARAHALRKRSDVERIAATADEEATAAKQALDRYAQLLTESENRPTVKKAGQLTEEDFTDLRATIASLELRRHQVIQALAQYDHSEMSVRFALEDATRSAAKPTSDHEIWKTNQHMMSSASQHYLARRAHFKQRDQNMHVKAEQVFRLVEEQLLRAAKATRSGPASISQTFYANLNEADNTPRILTLNPAKFATYAAPLPSLNNTVRSAVAGLTWEAAASQIEFGASCIAFDFERPGCGDPFAITVPLETMMPLEGQDWRHLADSNGAARTSFRMATGMTKDRQGGSLHYGLTEVKELSHAYVVSTAGESIGSTVSVRPAHWNSDLNGYLCTCSVKPLRQVVWTSGEKAALATPAANAANTVSHGYLSLVAVPVVAALDLVDDAHLDDCIVVFPAESGIDPVYVVFKSPGEYPGIASGTGAPVSNTWLTDNSPIPSQIADRLRGKAFKRFEHFREALWKTAATLPELCAGLSEQDLNAMKTGRPPQVSNAGNAGPLRFVLRVADNPDNGADVYDMDNLKIVKTPVKK